MKQVLCAVYDVVADTYLPPFVETNTGTAVRAFQQAMGGDSPPANCRDLVLFQIGTYDNVTGRAESLPDKVQLFRGADVLTAVSAARSVQ